MTSLVSTYESLLLSNLSAVRAIESGLRNVTWLLPGRFEDAELASEGLYALLNVVSGYHDTLLSKRLDHTLSLPPHPFVPASSDSDPAVSRVAPILPPPTDHARYTRYWTDRSPLYKKASRVLVILGYVELLVEMLARKKGGDRGRWRVVVAIESAKTMLRLLLLGITRRPVLSPPTPQREYDLLSLPSSVLSRRNGPSPDDSQVLARTNQSKQSDQSGQPDRTQPPSSAITPTLPAYAPLRSHLYRISGALPEDHLPHPLTLMPTLSSPSAWTAEIIESSVTLLHVILLLRASRRPKHPSYRRYSLSTLSSPISPFLIPLLLSLFARHLRRANPPPSSILLTEHYARLDRKLAARAFLTGPMWVGWTRPRIIKVVHALEGVPIVGLVGELVESYMSLVDDYFYYTSS